MKKRVLTLCIILLLVLSVGVSMVSCNEGKANSIQYNLLPTNELNYKQLEESNDAKMTLVENGASLFKIVIDNNSNKTLLDSALELQSVIKQMSGATLPIIDIVDKDSESNLILIDMASSLSLASVKEDGFALSIKDNLIEIKGNSYDASRNGVYTFIEDYLGVIFLTPTESYIPNHKNIYLEKQETVVNPKTAWRDVYAYETSLNFWAAKLKLNGIDVEKRDEEVLANRIGVNEENKHRHLIEGRQYTGWGTWCHNCYSYVNPDIYFEDHPEYFTYQDGERIHKLGNFDAQLCLSNEEVYNIISNSLNEKIASNPKAKYWDFSGNDSSMIPGCQCKECKKLDKEAGNTGMGSLMPVLNKLAKEHPDKYISSLAYFHTIKPPQGIEVEDNVVIKLCSMPGDQGSSYLNPQNKNAKDFNKLVTDWTKVCNKIVVWDYVVNFNNLLTPFPNFAVQQENQKFYEENGIQGIFHQASREKGGENAYLRSYILSKLMWVGSSMDVSKEVSKYVQAYYGDAAQDVLDYFNALAENLANNSSSLNLYENANVSSQTYLNKEQLQSYQNMIDEAFTKVEKDSVYYTRIEDLNMNLKYAIANNATIDKEVRQEALDDLVELAEKKDVSMVGELWSLEQYLDNYDKAMSDQIIQIYMPLIITISVLIGSGILIVVIFFLVKYLINKKKKKI